MKSYDFRWSPGADTARDPSPRPDAKLVLFFGGCAILPDSRRWAKPRAGAVRVGPLDQTMTVLTLPELAA